MVCSAPAQAGDVAETFDKKNSSSPVHRLQADHYAVGLKMQTLHAIGAVLVDEDVDAMLSVCATVAGMKDVRPPKHTVIHVHGHPFYLTYVNRPTLPCPTLPFATMQHSRGPSF